jgi:hypothetical protein
VNDASVGIGRPKAAIWFGQNAFGSLKILAHEPHQVFIDMEMP